jgi:type I restriction enzyme S subunit
MSRPSYSDYKNSGISWLGEVPAHWSIAAVGYRYEVLLGKMLDERRITGEHLAPYLRNVDVQWDRINTENLPEMDFSGNDLVRYALTPGDLLVCEGGEVGRAAIWQGDFGECYYQKALHRLRCRDHSKDLQRFMLYILRAASSLNVFTASEGKSTIAHLTAETLRGYRFAFPPYQEQKRIVDFLDVETSKIDSLIAEQEKLLTLLAEKRQATISHAVTRGLKSDTLMKDSGLTWLGDVPAHWEVKRLKTISPFITVGIVVNPSDYVSEEGLPFIYGGDISEGKISLDNCRKITPEDSQRQSKTMLESGDLLTVRVGAPGVTAVVPQSCSGGNCASVMLVRKGKFDSTWLCYAMNSRMVRFQVEVVQYGAAQEQFNISHAINFWIATPPQSEQADVAAFLEAETGKLDALKAEAERAIGLLKERRSALISAAVTGKIDVRNAALRELAA